MNTGTPAFARIGASLAIAASIPLAGCTTPLILAAKQADAAKVKALLDKGADVNARGTAGEGFSYGLSAAFRPDLRSSALEVAASQGNLAIVKLLVERGAKLTPWTLRVAAGDGHLELVEYLHSKGADINQQFSDRGTVLHSVALEGRTEMVRWLLDHGADINAALRDPFGISVTPLAFAALRGHTEVVKLLLERGADPSIPDDMMQKYWRRTELAPPIARMIKRAVEERERSAGGTLPDRQQAVAPAIDKEEMQRMMLEAAQKVADARQARDPAFQTKTSVKSDVDQPKYGKPANPADFAVVVGIEKYTSLPEAQFAERDAQSVRDHLLALGYPQRNIVLLTGGQASRAGLVKNLETRLPQLVNEHSTVFFYYSGHGAPDPKTGQAYLVPVDGDPEFLEDTAYPLKRLYQKLDALKAKRVIVALDSCFSGLGGRSVLAKGTRPLVSKVDLGEAIPGKIVALTASGGSQISGTIEEEGHGAFTYYLLRGLNGAAKDEGGAVTIKSLYDYLVPNVQDAARRSNRDQTPQLLPVVSGGAGAIRLR